MKVRQLFPFTVPFFLALPLFTNAQPQPGRASRTPNRDQYTLLIHKATTAIDIDGQLEEMDWRQAEVADDFWRVLPIDTGYAESPTEVRATYDDRNLYFAVTCFERDARPHITESLRRDFTFGANDNFLLFIDTYNDQTNGFSFGVSAAGAQWDGTQADGGVVALQWDCKWESAVKHYENYWNIEMAIPFRNLQFKAGMEEWGVNFSRMDVKNNEKSSWAPVPRQFATATLAFAGALKWDMPPPKPKTDLSLIPYVAARTSKDYEKEVSQAPSLDAGIDAKLSLTPSINLDLTVNPDFSQVDVDQQVTNLDRFELFFPERRRFFLENQDLFAGFGKDGLRPFFSRRIGLTNPVQAGLRLSGKLDEKWRIGLLNMQTGTEEGFPAANFTVASLQRRVFARSNVGAFIVNKQLTAGTKDIPDGSNAFNRVFGLDYNLASANNRWIGKFFLHHALSPGVKNENTALSGNLVYQTEQWKAEGSYDLVGANYLAETGFVRRRGLHHTILGLGYKFYPRSEKIANHGPSLRSEYFFDPDFRRTDEEWRAAYGLVFLNRSEMELSATRSYIRLLDPFDPTNAGGDSLAAGTDYTWNRVEYKYLSDARKLFNYNFKIGYGGFFNGDLFNFEGTLNYRFQPYGSIAINFAYNNLAFPDSSQDVDFFLIGPKLDLTFTTNLFLTAFVQYNEQADNLNTNIRLQWRYQPVSDLFIVYSDNYFPSPWNVRNRALVAKVSYWFN
ncbi:MAG: carbohydrate binding family 9 domain-containing protein [Phaeodactylibacter sp.]|nr:carbohydrate binding family 9 domain-containing protein [Phaeodactylibacter sp.]MCB9301902.1 carbohydrate binding family 9 domain-containing protein [Lewinellaceae bacterium]